MRPVRGPVGRTLGMKPKRILDGLEIGQSVRIAADMPIVWIERLINQAVRRRKNIAFDIEEGVTWRMVTRTK